MLYESFAASCATLPDGSNTKGISRSMGTFQSETLYTYDCPNGGNSSVVRCLSPGEWSMSLPKCKLSM